MKKHLLLLVFALVASVLPAQNGDMYSLMYHDNVGYYYRALGLMRQQDDDFIVNTYLFEDIGNYDYIPLGYMFYKMSPIAHALTDSLFMADTTMAPACSLAPNPQGEGNIRTLLEYHGECDSTFLRISHFPDNDLYINPSEDVVVPLCEGSFSSGTSFVDSSDDLVIQYYKEIDAIHYDIYAARFGLDGTLKCHTLLHENSV